MERGIDLTIIVQFQFHPFYQKYLKTIIHSVLSSNLDDNNILYSMQFGFRKNHGTYMPIVHIYDEITTNLQNNDKTQIKEKC